jgi:hypothetical protein
MVVAPRATLAAAQRGEGGGLDDLLLLVALGWLAARLPSVVRGVLFAVDLGGLDGLLIVGSSLARALVLPFAAAFVGGGLLALVRRPPARPVQGRSGAGALDLAGLCVVPGVVLQLVADLAQRLLHLPVPRPLVWGAGALWIAVLLLVAARLRHGAGDDEVAS